MASRISCSDPRWASSRADCTNVDVIGGAGVNVVNICLIL